MKKKISFKRLLILLGVLTLGLQSCTDKDNGGVPEQPDFIKLSLPSLMTFTNEPFDIYIPRGNDAESYEWSLPEAFTITDGEGTARITVVANAKGLFPEKSISVVAIGQGGRSVPRYLYKELTIALAPKPLDEYKTKRYGSKFWMIENLNETGENGELGRYYNDDPELGETYGRLYTWSEAMTGIANCPLDRNPYDFGASGKDDEGNDYIMDGSVNAQNIQIRGVCPEGWHIPNTHDMYDLVVAIADEYGLEATLQEVAASFKGITIGSERNVVIAMNLTNWGYAGAYLKGSKPVSEGGLWNGGNTFSYGGNSVFPNSSEYPLYQPEAETIGFNLLPGGRWNGSDKYEQLGQYAYIWASYATAPGRAVRYNVNYNNSNLSLYGDDARCGMYVRCVANY